MKIKEFFDKLFGYDKLENEVYESTIHYLQLAINRLERENGGLKKSIECFEHKSGYYIGRTDDGLESDHIYAERMDFYNDKYLFYRNCKIVGVLDSNTYKELVFVDSEKEN